MQNQFWLQDKLLKPFASALAQRNEYIRKKTFEITAGKPLVDFANGHLWYGLHKVANSWFLREWAPNATAIYLVGESTNWQVLETFRFNSLPNGNWELRLDEEQLKHGQLYKLLIQWPGGEGYRIPSYCNRAVQHPQTHVFDAQVWSPEIPYQWKNKAPVRSSEPIFIYESHVGMSDEEPRVSNFNAFTDHVLPRIKKAGYNCVQLMAIQEHPYYGSFGYHVSNFFAVSSRFGTPNDLKRLIDTAHGMGLWVIMDLVHSHSVKNIEEGLGLFDGTPDLYFQKGIHREHIAWDSLCFDYGKPQVAHFLLSNCRFWLDEYQFDGFRFDGVTSMLYFDHGLNKDFIGYNMYFDDNINIDAVCYLTLANELIHKAYPNAITVAEEMSGMPGLAASTEVGGVGFDFRMAMGTPDYWIKLLKDVPQEHWKMGELFYELNSHRLEEKTVSYAESHDQAIVGDKTIIFRLLDKNQYTSMSKECNDPVVLRGMALHKMIRLITCATAGGAYLNFMGNEFGHPDWIDFPREGNNWSYQYARRLWSLADKDFLRYHFLLDFDRDMIRTIAENNLYSEAWSNRIHCHESNKVLAFIRNNVLLVFNFHPWIGFDEYHIPVNAGKYKLLLSTDSEQYGGQGRIEEKTYFTESGKGYTTLYENYLRIALPALTAAVFVKQASRTVYDL